MSNPHESMIMVELKEDVHRDNKILAHKGDIGWIDPLDWIIDPQESDILVVRLAHDVTCGIARKFLHKK